MRGFETKRCRKNCRLHERPIKTILCEAFDDPLVAGSLLVPLQIPLKQRVVFFPIILPAQISLKESIAFFHC